MTYEEELRGLSVPPARQVFVPKCRPETRRRQALLCLDKSRRLGMTHV